MLLHYQSHLIATEIFPENACGFRFNTMTRRDCVSLLNHLDTIELISSTGDMNAAPPAYTGLADNFKVACSPNDSSKKHIKIHASLFNTFKEGKHWDTWRKNALVTARAQDVA